MKPTAATLKGIYTMMGKLMKTKLLILKDTKASFRRALMESDSPENLKGL